KTIDEGGDTHSFVFEVPKNLSWEAGQHGIFTIPKRRVEGRKWRAFSVASSEKEGVIRIATHICDEPSDFKKKLLELVPGDTINMRGPFGEFHVVKTKHAIGIAGGIGVTPLRAIAYEIANDIITDVTLDLIYAGKNGRYTFQNDWTEFEKHSKINVYYVDTADEVNDALDSKAQTFKNHASYYISGSPGMARALHNRLKSQGVTKIISDPFEGY
ncbi:MAG: FAD-dependent oxidoreductase, partial [Candidatus Pacebacteria bacterium]|nr:FAD-dependent oxidoreductase [Candidatus Paceibacterota bacterium]